MVTCPLAAGVPRPPAGGVMPVLLLPHHRIRNSGNICRRIHVTGHWPDTAAGMLCGLPACGRAAFPRDKWPSNGYGK